MRIGDYLKSEGLDEEGFAARSGGAFSSEAVRKWRFGQRTPRLKHLVQIAELTNGAVTANDFLPSPSPSEEEAA
ncbi:XRE family transcriptional regulator [Enterovirga rhinocerotis]|uniref:XRE family transcriptional regulator n=1 Tax=Enterovirga rhinocerotis TaxID=1339210 RepID=A0A4R7C1E9_9HYPH|nr:XRE family transcriptional regulator [Enterovirga rhinocerotis]TDR90327.1 hypothetical protein EV668_3176 [Enterovirga rhinocerotis]